MAIWDKAILFGSKLASNKAIGKIPALASQAVSYSGRAASTARSLAEEMATGASHLGRNAAIGAGVGAVGGVGYNYASDDRSTWRSMLKYGIGGGLLGGGLGAGYSLGRSGANMIRSRGVSTSSVMSDIRSARSSAGKWWGGQVRAAQFRADNAASPLGVAMDSRAEAMRGL